MRQCFAVSPADARFNISTLDENLVEVLAEEEGQPVSVQQIYSQVHDDLVLVTLIDAAGSNAVSSKSLSQTLMIQALNPSSRLRARGLGTPLLDKTDAASTAEKADLPACVMKPRFTEKDIAAFALAKLAKDQQQICERMRQEIEALRQGLDSRRSSGSTMPTAQMPSHQSCDPPIQDDKPVPGNHIDVKLDALRQTTLRQTQERNQVIAKLEDVLVCLSATRNVCKRTYVADTVLGLVYAHTWVLSTRKALPASSPPCLTSSHATAAKLDEAESVADSK